MSGGVPRYRVVPAAYVVLQRAGEVLLQLRRGTGFMDEHWACGAAGHVEAGESVVEAAVREAREELGVVLAPADLEPLAAMHRTGGTGRDVDERVDVFFSCHRWQGTPRTAEPDRSADLRWFPLGALPEPVVPHERVVLEAIATGRVPAVMTHGF